jgi:cytochrome c-type biogenesis protein CcmH
MTLPTILLWSLFAVMTAGVLLALLRPLTRAPDAHDEPAATADIAVYKAQLAEVDADLARGLIQPAEAEIARREIARRLLAAAPDAPQTVKPSVALRPVALGLMAGVPLAAIATYIALGAPHLPAAPFAARKDMPVEKAPVDDLIARVEARLASNPDDGQGWDVIAPVYFRMQRFAEAAEAYERAAKLLGETVPRLAGFAESATLAANGIVTEPARLAYEKIAKADPSRIEPKFWLALALEQDGKVAEAAAAYRALLAGAPKDASWRPLVEERLAAVTGGTPTPGRQAPPPPQAAPRGPSADDVAAAGKMTDADRAQMIRGMVDGLAKRLEANPDDVQGWQRLVQSFVVLGERDRAVAALGEARRKLAGNAQALSDLTALAKSLGLGS